MDAPSAPRHPEQLLLNEIQVMLAEKRTYYGLFRLGIGVITLPLTITGFLIATRDYHGIFERLDLSIAVLFPLAVICIIGIRLCTGTHRKIGRIDRLISGIKAENPRIAEILV